MVDLSGIECADHPVETGAGFAFDVLPVLPGQLRRQHER
jgi:hypothetical protein